ncbi:MAG: response regulator transcription factor [Anaerolineae bacterium]|nr:response regulator transcription factor [Anaerolineae bacterium]
MLPKASAPPTLGSTSAHILIVDDEVANRYSISKSLQKVGLMTSEAGNADEALEMLTEGEYDVVLTDIKMPGSMDGVELLRHIRTESPDAVVILMTGYASFRTQRRRKLLMDSIQHNLEELTRDGAVRAEVGQAALAGVGAGAGGGMGGRWAEPEAQVTATVRLGALTVFPGSYQISTGERAVDLTPTEFDLLMYLGTNSGRVVPCHELVREVRSYAVDEAEAREVIRPHISNLRRKLKAAGQNPDLIVNVRGLGYRLNDRAR